MTHPTHILRIDASARTEGSISRSLADKVIDRMSALGPVAVTKRDTGDGLSFVDSDWVSANFTPADQRSDAQKAKLASSDALVEELKAADILVVSSPIYNFGVPASLKAWIDQIARAGLTFRYTENGPVGLLDGKRAIVLIASGGTQSGSAIDFATPYLRHVLGFVGIHDVTVIAADALSKDAAAKLQEADTEIQALTM